MADRASSITAGPRSFDGCTRRRPPLSERRAPSFEFRDHVRPDHRGTVHYWSVRAGFVFR
jgi:hypothetical protein